MKSYNKKIFLFLLPILTIAIRLIIFNFIPHTYEDAYITFRYAENFAEGLGLVYNMGEYVYGTTTPLFAIIVGLFNVVGVSSIIAALILNMLAEGIITIILFKILSDISNNILAAVITILFVFSPSNISWSIQGMETAFFGTIIAISFFFYYRENYFYSLLFAFGAAMIRIDGLSVAAVISFFTLFEKRKEGLKLFIITIIIFCGWLSFLYLYYGNVLPNSMIAKLILYSGHQTSFLPNLSLIFSKFIKSGSYSSSILTLLFISGIFITIKKKIRLFPFIAWFVLYYFLLVVSKTNIHGWYLIPPLSIYILISGVAVIFILKYLIEKYKLNEKLIYISLFLIIIFFSSFTLTKKISQMEFEYNYEKEVRTEIGEYIKHNTPPGSKVFLEPIGVIGYYSERYIYDDAALISPVFLEFNKLPYNSVTRYKKIEYVKPDYLVIRDKYLKDFYNSTDLINNYKVLKNFPFEEKPSHPELVSMTLLQRK